MTGPVAILVLSAVMAACIVGARVQNKLSRAYAMRKWVRPDIAPLEETLSFENAPPAASGTSFESSPSFDQIRPPDPTSASFNPPPFNEPPSSYEQAPSSDARRPMPFRPSPLAVVVALSIGGFLFLQVIERSPMGRGVAPVAIPIVFGMLGLISYRTRRQWWKDWAESQSRRRD